MFTNYANLHSTVHVNFLIFPPVLPSFETLSAIHHNTAAVYQVTRLGHEHCDITEGELLDITPLIVDGRKLVTLYDKDLTEGINLLIGMSFSSVLFACYFRHMNFFLMNCCNNLCNNI